MLISDLKLLMALVDRFKMFILVPIYAVMFMALNYRAFLLFVPFWFLAAVAYTYDQQRERQGMDDFRGGWLFFRYGEEVNSTSFAIPVDVEWSAEQTATFASELREDLATGLRRRMPGDSVVVIGSLPITDLETREEKTFLRMTIRSRFGSLLTHFVHYATFGRTITAHYFTYLRGTHTDWDTVKFILASPWSIWFWAIPWLLNRYSIIARISRPRASSFDDIDLRTMATLTGHILYTETAKLLEQAGFLTEEIEQILQYNVQNIQITGSSKVNLQGVTQSAVAQPRLRSVP